MQNLHEIANRCHPKGIRTYLTLNNTIYCHDLSMVKTLMQKAKETLLAYKTTKFFTP
jgi:putative protease